MSNEAMKNIGIKEEVATALMHLAYHIKHEDIDLNTIADCFEMTGDFRQPQQVESDVNVIKNALCLFSKSQTDVPQTYAALSQVFSCDTEE